MQPQPDELDYLKALAEEKAEAFAYGWHPVDRVDELASEEELHGFADHVFDIYDDLLGVETGEAMRDEMKDSINYDINLLDKAKIAATPAISLGAVSAIGCGFILGSAHMTNPVPEDMMGWTMAMIAGTVGGLSTWIYGQRTQAGRYFSTDLFDGPIISISPDKTAKDSAYKTLLSEVLHAYQDLHGSPTFNDMHLQEGMDRAVKTRSAGILAEEGYEDLDWDGIYRELRSGSLVHAYSILHGEDDGESVEALQELGFDEHDAESFIEGARDMDYFKSLEEYTIGAAAVFLAEEEYGDQVYEEVFHGNFDLLPDWFEPQPRN